MHASTVYEQTGKRSNEVCFSAEEEQPNEISSSPRRLEYVSLGFLSRVTRISSSFHPRVYSTVLKIRFIDSSPL